MGVDDDVDDDALFEDDEPAELTPVPAPTAAQAPWRILLVDDEPDVHAVTRMALQGVRVDGALLEIVSALSRAEAERALHAHPDIALAILDVVMETDDAGLVLARHIRETYADPSVRIVLRTGQPGVAPEERVLRDYDINDYWAKTELSAMRMRTLVTGNLRSCRDLRTIESHRAGLMRVIGSTAMLFRPLGIEALIQAILDHLTQILPTRSAALFSVAPAAAGSAVSLPARVVGATGRFSSSVGKQIEEVLEPAKVALLQRCVRESAFLAESQVACFGFNMADQPSAAIFMDSACPLGPLDQHMLELFCRNAAIAFHNQTLTEERLRLLAAVSRFVPNELLGLLGHADVGSISLGDHADHTMTVLFGDLHAFSGIAELMSSAEAFELLRSFHAHIGPAIARHGGIVDKYLGDGIMVLFPGGPEPCVAAAADVLDALGTMNRDRTNGGECPLVLSLGAHHGRVTVGTLGFAGRLETTVVSDAVNVASRLEQLTRVYQCSLVISDEVHSALPPTVQADCRCLGTIPIKGRAGTVRIFDAFSADPDRDAKRATRARFETAVAHLAAGHPAAAITEFDAVLRIMPGDGPARVLRAQAAAAIPVDA